MPFTLELKFSGLILLDQQASGPAAGVSLYMMQHGTHTSVLKVGIAGGTVGPGTVIPLAGVYERYSRSAGGMVQSTVGLANLSTVSSTVGKVVKHVVHAGWLADPPPNGLLARLRLPLATALLPVGDTVELEFNTGFASASTQKVKGSGLITVTIDADALHFEGHVLEPVDGRMLLCIENYPVPDDEVILPGETIANHHLHACFALFRAPGSVAHLHLPVRLLNRWAAVDPEPNCGRPRGFAAMAAPLPGGDPAQCTSGTI